MIAIHICLDCKFLGIAEGFLTSLQPMSDRVHETLVDNPEGMPGNIFSALQLFCWVGLYQI
jgi:hypothetical protein